MIEKRSVWWIYGLIFLLLTLSLQAAPDIKEGKWSVTAQLEAPDLPKGMIPPVTVYQCIDSENKIPKIGPLSPKCGNCRITEVKELENGFQWKEECDSPEGKIYAVGRVIYHHERFEGVIKMTQGGETVVNHITGKWIAPCDSK